MPHSTYLPERMGTADDLADRRRSRPAASSRSRWSTPPAISASTTPARSRSCIASPATWGGRNGATRRRRTTPRSRRRTARCSTCCYDPKMNIRPWDKTLFIRVVRGFLREGDTITVRFGDRAPGLARHADADLRRADLRVPRAGRRLRDLQLRRAADAADDLDRRRPAGAVEGGAADPAPHAARLSGSVSRARTNGAIRATRSRARSRCAPICRSAACRRPFRCSAASTPSRSRACRSASRATC